MKDRTQRLFFLLSSLLVILRFGNAKKEVRYPKRMIIFQLAKMGDMVCTTPMFRAVKEKYPNSHLTVVGDNVNQELLAGNNDVDDYLVWPKSNSFTLINVIKSGNYDFGCTAGPSFEALVIMVLSRIPLVSVPKVENGWSPYETIPYKILRRFVVTKTHLMGNYAPREYLKLLEPIDIFTNDTRKNLHYSNEANNSVEGLFIKNGINKSDFLVGISPSAGNKIKNWPADRFAKVANHLIEKYGAKVVVTGGKGDLSESKEMVNNIKYKKDTVDLTGKISIEELKALISKLKLYISVDTGPIYIAEAFGVPTIDIVGPMDENEQPPRGDGRAVIVPVRTSSAIHIMNARVYDVEKARTQVESITSETVIGVIDNLKEREIF